MDVTHRLKAATSRTLLLFKNVHHPFGGNELFNFLPVFLDRPQCPQMVLFIYLFIYKHLNVSVLYLFLLTTEDKQRN